MRKIKAIDTDALRAEDLVELDDLIAAFQNYLRKELRYSKKEAEMASADMESPYQVPYVMQRYWDTVEIDGISYEIRYCNTDFCACGLFHLADAKSFEFLMLFDESSMPDQTTTSYINARKKFVV